MKWGDWVAPFLRLCGWLRLSALDGWLSPVGYIPSQEHPEPSDTNLCSCCHLYDVEKAVTARSPPLGRFDKNSRPLCAWIMFEGWGRSEALRDNLGENLTLFVAQHRGPEGTAAFRLIKAI